ncbi:MAG: M16 family metallopeptidase [Hyphomicrobium sp.]
MIHLAGRRLLATLIAGLTMLAVAEPIRFAAAASRVTEYRLDNGMQVVVIPDTRAPVVTHMVWYRVGAADEPKGVSGIAHFLEHLMFKSTDKIPMGEFSKIVARLGGQDNAFTGHDATAYFQRISKDKLRTVMEMEADRMVNLRLTEKEVLTERDVILEERRSRIENNPSAILEEQMDAALYYSHPYGIPVIGWEHEMAQLSPQDAMSYYHHWYAPNNAILVVAGDVTPEEVRTLATEIYGPLKPNSSIPSVRKRPQDPPHRAARRLELRDARAGKASLHRDYATPSYQTASGMDAEALDLLGKILADGATSRVYKALVVDQQVASSTGGGYSGSSLDSGKMSIYAVAADGVTLEKVEAALDAVIADIRAKGVTAAELERAKSSYIADYIYESDNQMTLARRYGWGLAIGRSIEKMDAWADDIAKITLDDVKKAAAYLDPKRSVTGTLIPTASDGGAGGPQKPAASRS